MELGKHLDLGAVATGTASYTGHHRLLKPIKYNEPLKWAEEPVGCPLGNRASKPYYGMSEVEERGSDPNVFRGF